MAAEALLRKVGRGLIGAVVVSLLCFAGLKVYDRCLAIRYDAIRQQRQREATAALASGPALTAAKTWFSGRGMEFREGTYGLSGDHVLRERGTVLVGTEVLSSGSLFQSPVTLIMQISIDREDRVEEISGELLNLSPRLAPVPAAAERRRVARIGVPLFPLVLFGLWAIWTLSRDARQHLP